MAGGKGLSGYLCTQDLDEAGHHNKRCFGETVMRSCQEPWQEQALARDVPLTKNW